MDASEVTNPIGTTAGVKRTSSGGQAPTRPRKRNATACTVCRARKTKCDNKKPTCSYCQSVGAVCEDSNEEPIPCVSLSGVYSITSLILAVPSLAIRPSWIELIAWKGRFWVDNGTQINQHSSKVRLLGLLQQLTVSVATPRPATDLFSPWKASYSGQYLTGSTDHA